MASHERAIRAIPRQPKDTAEGQRIEFFACPIDADVDFIEALAEAHAAGELIEIGVDRAGTLWLYRIIDEVDYDE